MGWCVLDPPTYRLLKKTAPSSPSNNTESRNNNNNHTTPNPQGSEGHSPPASMASTVDLSTLAHVSEGYTAGSIYRSVKTTLTPRRVHRIAKRPLLSSEFLGVLAQQQQLLKKHVQASFL